MTCQEIRDRLPDESLESLLHAATCESCRLERERYDRDLQLLAEGLLGLAEDSPSKARPPGRPSRSIVPLTVAAATLVGVLTLVIVPVIRRPVRGPGVLEPVEQVDADTATRRSEARQLLAEAPVRVGRIVGLAEGSGQVTVDLAPPTSVRMGDEFSICRRDAVIAKIVVTAIYDQNVVAQVAFRESEPHLEDDVFETLRLAPTDRRAVLDFVFSFHPIAAQDREAFDSALADLGHPGTRSRKQAVEDLIGQGGPAWLLVGRLDPAREAEDVRLGLKEVRERWNRLEELAGGPGLERDVEFLSSLPDQRAYPRLRRILSTVQPYSRDGFPEAGAGLAESIHAWWVQARSRVGWNAELDRYEEKAR